MAMPPRAVSADALSPGASPKSARASHNLTASDLPSFKICVVGDYAVGKSSLIRQLTTRQFLTQNAATIGVEFKEHRLPDCVLQLWDIAGQSRASSMTKQYYRFSAAAIVVADVSNESSFAVALEWKADIVEKMSALVMYGGATPSTLDPSGNVASGSPSGRSSPTASPRGAQRPPPNATRATATSSPRSPKSPVEVDQGGATSSTSPIPIFLFANKSDLLGTSNACERFGTCDAIEQFAEAHGFCGWAVTSAKEFESTLKAFRTVAASAEACSRERSDQLMPARATVQITRSKRERELEEKGKKSCCKKS